MKFFIFAGMISLCVTWQSSTAQIIWQKYTGNPILRYWTGDVDDPNGYKYALDATVLPDKNGLYHGWFTSLAFGWGTSFCVSEAISVDKFRWFTDFKNPLLRPGPPGTFEERGIRAQSIIKDSVGYKLYYMGLTLTNDNAIGLATSPDGVTWTKCPTNPVLDAGPQGTWDSLKASSASVYYDGTVYYLWYTGEDGPHRAIGLATSSDGISWTKHSGNPILDVGAAGSWDDKCVEAPKVVRVGNIFHMFYDGNNVSPDVNAFRIGYAFSTDGIHWTRYAGNPVLSIGTPSEWDGQSLGTMTLLYQNRKFHMWYSGLGFSSTYWQTGYASSDSTFVDGPRHDEIPSDFFLSQNYPNPFNPGTTIRYEVPRRTHITLKVYDVLGKEVTTLVDRAEDPGHKDVKFDGSNMASGTYFYRMEAGGFSNTKRMTLTK